MHSIKTFLTTLLLVLVSSFSFSQNFWNTSTSEPSENLSNRAFTPTSYMLITLNVPAFKQFISTAPKRFENTISNVIVSMPDARGAMRDFTIYEAPMMEPELYNKYPSIRTYVGESLQSPGHVIRFSLTYQGLHSIEFRPGEATVYTDPFTVNGTHYIIYSRDDIPEMNTGFVCETIEPQLKAASLLSSDTYAKAANDATLRKYRVAISCNAEYGNIFAGTTGTDADKRMRIQAQQAITMNRVNGIYERDLAITLEFVAQNDLLLYYGDTTLDPYTNDFNGRTQTLIDGGLASQGFPGIGNGAYDIGHNFNTSGGGNAGCIGCVCVAGQKGSGMTGRANPTGDPFDIDYVAHEMGHQFGGFHSMASSNCRSGNGQTEAEPGSGSTIMAYAGICTPNVQQNSDDYFHFVNVRDITANIKSGVSSACPTIISLNIPAPVVNAGSDYTIPFSTAFVLDGTATNVTSGTTYIWEQFDTDNPRSSAGPMPTRELGPMYRSRLPVTSTFRYFPILSSVFAGNLTPAFEVTPSVDRTMKFALTARNFTSAGGQNGDDNMLVTVDGTKGPFVITSMNSPVTFNTGESTTITWDVAGTDLAPINTQFVDILLTTNGGTSFMTLAASVPNDGSHVITIPVINPTNNARFMIRAVGNVYYAVNAAPISITQQNFSLSTTEFAATACQPSSPTFDFTYNVFAGFTENTTLSVTGLPAGVNAVISPQTVSTAGTSINLSFTGVSSAALGSYPIDFVAIAPSVTKTVPLNLIIASPSLSPTALTSPLNSAIDQDLSPVLSWTADSNATSYLVEVATDASFTNVIQQATVMMPTYRPVLLENTTYYWRVRSINSCATGSPSATRSFKTATISCSASTATSVPVAISTGAPATVTGTLNVVSNLDITSVTVTMDLSHTYIADLVLTLISPAGTRVKLLEAACTSRNDIAATFTDEGMTLSCNQSAPTVRGLVIPDDALAILNGENSLGTWTLEIADTANIDGGSLNSWSLNICGIDKTLSIDSELNAQISLYPNPVTDMFTMDFGNYAFAKADYQLYDLTGKLITTGFVQTARQQLDMTGMAQGLYLLRLRVDDAVVTRKIIKE